MAEKLRSKDILHRMHRLLHTFWDRVAIGEPDECWIWQAGRSSDGYGVFKVGPGTRASSHRVAWALHNQAEPRKAHVCHTCDNPLCCNPGHLFLGTARDNMADKVKKGRARGRFSVKLTGASPEMTAAENAANLAGGCEK